MAQYSYGVVVEDYNPGYGIWLLFSGTDSYLTQLDAGVCDNLHVGAIVQARTDEGETRIRQSWPYPESIWSDRKRVVVRTIVSYNSQITIDRGKWTDNASGAKCVNLFSRDLGIVLAPTQWYNREFFDAGECHLLVYAEYGARTLTNPATWEQSEFFWTIIEDRLSLPVSFPTKDEERDKFLEPDEIRKVPSITVQRQGSGMLVWSYGLGDRMAIILNVGENLPVGMWLTTTVIRSSRGDLHLHGCTYTVVNYDSAIPFSQPDVRVVNENIVMVLSINRSEVDPGNPAAGVKLWHDFWGLPIGYDEEAAEWIRGVEVKDGTFRGLVEIGLSEEAFEGRRVSIKAIGPAAAPRMGKSPLPPVDTDAIPKSLEDLAALKNALVDEDRPKGARPIEQPTNERNDSNNNDGQWSTQDQSVSSAAVLTDRSAQSPVELSREWSGFGQMRRNDDYRRAVETRKKDKEQEMAKKTFSESESKWGEIPQKDLAVKKSANSTPQTTSPKRKEEQLNWKEWKKGDEKEKKKEKEKEGADKEKEKPKDDLADKDWYVTFSIPPISANGLKGFGKNRGMWKDPPKYELRPKRPYGPGTPGYVDPTKVPPGGKVTLCLGSAIPQTPPVVPQTPVPAAAEPPVKPKKSEFDGNIVGPIPIRAFEDKKTERKWKAEMATKGWIFPKEREEIIIPDGEDGWDQMGSKDFGKPQVMAKSPMPVEVLLNKRTIVRDAMRLKQRQCLITKVRFDVYWKDADRIQLFILDGTPAYIVHTMSNYLGNHSYLKNLPEFTTVGNIVELHVGRSSEGFYVHDEMWRLVTKINLPMREVVFEPGRVKTLELIVNCRCLGPDAQDRHNDRHRYDEKGFTMLNDEILHNIVYYGRGIDAREHDDYTFQVTVEPDEVLDGHAFWKATDVHWRVMKEKIPDFDADREIREPPLMPPPRPRPPIEVKIKASTNTYENYALMYAQPCTVARETRLEELFALYGKMIENDKLMTELFKRTGTDYKKKFRSAIEVGQTAMPHKKSMKRELQINADFLISIVENAYSEQLFREVGEKRLWKTLVKTSDSIKAFRSTVNNR